MKVIEVTVTEARSLEHAMDQAIVLAKEAAEEGKWLNAEGDKLQLVSVKFAALEVVINYRGNDWTYTFKAELR